MQRTVIEQQTLHFPASVQPYVCTGRLFDSSSSPQATVYYSDQDHGYFIKTAAAGTLRREATLTAYFHGKGLAAEVLYYGQETGDSGDIHDWMVTPRVAGEDCTAPQYLADPHRMTEILAHTLRSLHDMDGSDCPEPKRMERYVATAKRNHDAGRYDTSFYVDWYGDATIDEIFRIAEQGAALCSDVLLHGDYCLPNVILDDWSFSGFVDLDCAGLGDRHVDVFWALWTLRFNLHTDAYRDYFLDAYGRDLVDEEKLRTIAAIEVFG
ncbi:aminoglycoside 3'-phosphotransferase [Bifidobacterium amazonense]|uniref:Aminoglycoside 3'-phosphotransferase n=1 Tax=Bifidobacterium amazonense TaxID=2809027 RepID=A0ABS9VYU2_9BIFI|nr:aminoglycoside 3'-phosphotransferase [Bifidobacterium amazonense]MCH9277285.1 aminoglycoside 3'-phosphotransferase [Bifidobacterium amazonense]